ncbi:MAG: flagellar hook-associated protein FlgL [Terrimesophilobacter sp.]
MINRVTNLTSMQAAQRNLQAGATKMARLQDQASSQRAINRPSDDPAGTVESMRVRAAQRSNDQYSRNIDDGMGWLTTIDSTLGQASDIMRRVRDLTVQGANDGTMSPTAKQSIAVELEGLKSDLMVQANATYAGRTVFAGNSSAGVAVNPTNYSVTNRGTVERRVGDDTTVRVDVDAAAAFGSGSTSMFAVIDGIVNDLRNTGNNVGHYLGDLDTGMAAMVSERAAAGVRQSQLERAGGINLEKSGSLEAQRAGVEDTDLGQVILNLKMQEVAYQSTLAVTARVLQPTLMDFLH